MQGNCPQPVPDELSLEDQSRSCRGEARRSGTQCVIVTPQTMLAVSTAKRLWIDNLFVSIVKRVSQAAAVLTSRPSASAKIYVTHSTFTGGCKGSVGIQSHDDDLLVAGTIMRCACQIHMKGVPRSCKWSPASLHDPEHAQMVGLCDARAFADSQFDHFATRGAAAAISAVGPKAAVTLRGVRFTNNDAAGLTGANVLIARRASVVGCTFDSAGEGMRDVTCSKFGDPIFSDDLLKFDDKCQPRPVDDQDAASLAARRELPRLRDEWISTLMAVRATRGLQCHARSHVHTQNNDSPHCRRGPHSQRRRRWRVRRRR